MDKKLKIAIIGSRGYPYVYSGYETLVKELSERLVKKGHKVRIYCHISLFEKKPKLVNGVELVYTPSIETKSLSQFINSFFSTIHFCFSSFDVGFYVNSANGPFGVLTKIFRKKTCINVDGLEWLRPKWKGLGAFYFKIASKIGTIYFDEIITDSLEMNKIYLKKFNKKSTIIAYGSTMIKTIEKKILKKYNLQKNEYYLIVGRLIPDNNSKLICEGFLKSNSQKKLVIVGDVPYNDSYSKSLKSFNSDKIIFTGYINGHEYGGTNPTMINALDLNCNILALDTIFNKEMLKNKSSLLFKKDINDIKKNIQKIEDKYSDEVFINTKYTLEKKYHWDYIAKQYENVFKNLIR